MSQLPLTLTHLFAAENDRDWQRLAELVHPEVTWVLVGGETQTISGRDSYVARLRQAYTDRPTAHFRVERFRTSSTGRVLVELVNDNEALSVEIFELYDGLVVREWEFLFGPTTW